MALTDIGGFPLMMPGLVTGVSTPGIGTNITVDASGEYDCIILQARQAMTISHVGFIGGAVGSPTLDVRIETVDVATGLPSGTLWATNTNIVTAALPSTWTLQALTASASIALRDTFAVKLLYNGGTSFATRKLDGVNVIYGKPYFVQNTGTPAKTLIGSFVLALGSSTTVFYPLYPLYPFSAITSVTFNNTDGSARGMRFQVAAPCRIVGLRRTNVSGAVGDYNIVVYDDAGNELNSSSTACDGDIENSSGGARGFEDYFDNPVALSAATWYRVAIEPSSATNVGIYTATFPSADYRTASPWGVNAYYTVRTSGVWADTTTQIPFFDLLLDQFDDGVQVGGGGGRPEFRGSTL